MLTGERELNDLFERDVTANDVGPRVDDDLECPTWPRCGDEPLDTRPVQVNQLLSLNQSFSAREI